MKFCPTCQTRYDEEILRFCTRDGTPLVDENQPNFTALPSESSIEDLDEQTVIRRNRPNLAADEAAAAEDEQLSQQQQQERIVIPTAPAPRQEDVARSKVVHQPAAAAPRKSNTAVIVLLTVLGTLAVLGAGLGGWYALSGRNAVDANRNINVNTNPPNMNVNINADANSPANFNFNVNANINANANVNANANLKTPTPSPSKTPTPTPTKTPDANANVNANTNLNVNTNTSAPPAATSPSPTRTPTPTPSPSNQVVNAGVLNSRAVSLPKPAYPPTARQMNASGQVTVQVTIDEEGNVLTARAVNGHALLRSPAEAAARQSRFNPVRVAGQPVRATGVVLYNFINQ
jgi:TonB family protein